MTNPNFKYPCEKYIPINHKPEAIVSFVFEGGEWIVEPFCGKCGQHRNKHK